MARSKRRTHRVAIRINQAEKAKLEKAAAVREVPMSWVVREFIKNLPVPTGAQR